jgi:hypothetical protein
MSPQTHRVSTTFPHLRPPFALFLLRSKNRRRRWNPLKHLSIGKHGKHLELLQQLHQPALPGRPRTIRPVGIAGGQPVQARTRAIEGGAVKYRGLLILHRFEGEAKVYEGMVGDNRTVPGYFLDDNGVGVHGQKGDGKDVVVWKF